jgi:hypothetical protein
MFLQPYLDHVPHPAKVVCGIRLDAESSSAINIRT